MSLITCFIMCIVQALDEHDIKHWTPFPKSSESSGPAWRLVAEESWRDDRIRQMDLGPAVGGTIEIKDEKGEVRVTARKGLAIAVGNGTLIYDRNLMQCQGGWLGAFLDHDDARFGLMNIPENPVPALFWAPARAGVFLDGIQEKAPRSPFFPLPPERLDYQGLHFHGDEVVLEYDAYGRRILEQPGFAQRGAHRGLTRTLEISKGTWTFSLRLLPVDQDSVLETRGSVTMATTSQWSVGIGGGEGLSPRIDGEGWLVVDVSKKDHVQRLRIVYAESDEAAWNLALPDQTEPSLESKRGHGPLRYPEVLTTRIERAEGEGPYRVERIVPPFENPWKALCFMGGIDFLSTGELVCCTAHGDVWIVRNYQEGPPRWKRFCTGLYQPMGLKVKDDQIYVLERGQLTRLHDQDFNDEADFLENVNNRWETPGYPHAFDLGLEIDGEGYFCFTKNGAWETSTGGCVLRIPPDGEGDAEIFATGFRHGNSMGVSPDGQLTGGGQQGHWMPATRLDRYRSGGFYGLMQAHHREVEPETFDRPFLWLPIEADSSAGNQVWAPEDWGPLGGEMLHLSWSQCWMLHIITQDIGKQTMGFGHVLPWPRFMAGPMRATFSPHDGQLYVAGLKGWQTWGPWDGTIERVRFTGKQDRWVSPVSAEIQTDGVTLSFAQPLDPKANSNLDRYELRQWNYYWSAAYGSDRWSVRTPQVQGEDSLSIRSADLSEDRRTLQLFVDDWRPAMQTVLNYRIRFETEEDVRNNLYFTIHRLPRKETNSLLLESSSIRAEREPWMSAYGPFDDGEFTIEFKMENDQSVGKILVRGQAPKAFHGSSGYHLLMGPGRWGVLTREFGESVTISERPQQDAYRHQQWNTYRVRCEGRHIQTWLNGTLCEDFREADTRIPVSGYMGIAGDVDIRKITFTPLD